MTPAAFPWPHWIVHRGGGDAAPENTLAGMLLAAFAGAKWWNSDVRLSVDGVPFYCMTTRWSVPPTAMARPMRCRGKCCPGWTRAPGFRRVCRRPLPSLADAAQLLNDHSLCANVEIKTSPGREAKPAHGWRRIAPGCLLARRRRPC